MVNGLMGGCKGPGETADNVSLGTSRQVINLLGRGLTGRIWLDWIGIGR